MEINSNKVFSSQVAFLGKRKVKDRDICSLKNGKAQQQFNQQ
jgi:hypothetical protein